MASDGYDLDSMAKPTDILRRTFRRLFAGPEGARAGEQEGGGITALPPDAWVRVEDRLPEPGVEVLVRRVAKGPPRRTIALYRAEGYWSERWGHRSIRHHTQVTHWCTLPQLPEG